MAKFRASGVIRIITAPVGGLPPEIAALLVGAILPTFCLDPHDRHSRDVVTKKELPSAPRYLVLQSDAVSAIIKKDPTAAEWFNKNWPVGESTLCSIDKDCAVEESPVTPVDQYFV